MDSEYKVFFMDVQNRTLYRQIKTGFPINRGSLKSKKAFKTFSPKHLPFIFIHNEAAMKTNHLSHEKEVRSRITRYTLVELLVVISVIAILASLLVPILAGARRSARLAQCTANGKQFGQLNMVYTQGNDGYEVPIINESHLSVWQPLLWNQSAVNAQMPVPTGTDVEGGTKAPWVQAVKSSNIFLCPADDDAVSAQPKLAGKSSDADLFPKTSYAFNATIVDDDGITGSRTTWNNVKNRLTHFDRPSMMILVTDTAMLTKERPKDGYLFSNEKVLGDHLRPGSIINPWDQCCLHHVPEGSESDYNLSKPDKKKMTPPWHTGKTMNYTFLDGHVSNWQPMKTIMVRKSGSYDTNHEIRDDATVSYKRGTSYGMWINSMKTP